MRLVLGAPLNKADPSLPGSIVNSTDVRTLVATTYEAACPLGNKVGQNGVDGHSGTMRVPSALHRHACWITLGIKYTGGQSQLFSLH